MGVCRARSARGANPTMGIMKTRLMHGVKVVGAAMVVLLASCEKEPVKTYRVAKPAERSGAGGANGNAGSGMTGNGMPGNGMAGNGMSGGTMPGSAPGGAMAASGGKVVWSLPAGWVEVPTTQEMRLATIRVAIVNNAEVTITAFPGDVGGNLANVNRWRGQLGLAAVGEGDLGGILTAADHSSSVGVVKVWLTKMANEASTMLGAIVVPGDGKTWFVKSTLPHADAATLEKDFAAFVGTFHVEAGGSGMTGGGMGAAPMPSGMGVGEGMALPPGHPPTGVGMEVDVNAGLAQRAMSWRPPAHWQADTSSGFAAVAYNIPGDGGEGEQGRATLTSLIGDGGGLLENINRWRGQMGLEAVVRLSDQAFTPIGARGMRFDLTSADGKNRMIAVILPTNEQSWYFKLSGPAAVVEKERGSFDEFTRLAITGNAKAP